MLFPIGMTKHVTGPRKAGLIYTKYTCLYYGTYLLLCMCYPKSVNFIEFLVELCIHDDIFNVIHITNRKLLHFKLSKSGNIIRVDKTCFPKPSHMCIHILSYYIPYVAIAVITICIYASYRPRSEL